MRALAASVWCEALSCRTTGLGSPSLGLEDAVAESFLCSSSYWFAEGRSLGAQPGSLNLTLSLEPTSS